MTTRSDDPVFTKVAGWDNGRLMTEFNSLVVHAFEDALDNGELRLLGAVAFTLANRAKRHG